MNVINVHGEKVKINDWVMFHNAVNLLQIC